MNNDNDDPGWSESETEEELEVLKDNKGELNTSFELTSSQSVISDLSSLYSSYSSYSSGLDSVKPRTPLSNSSSSARCVKITLTTSF